MPTFLTDPAPGVYLILVVFAVVTGFIAAKYQDRGSLIRFGIALAILFSVFTVDKTIESPREEAVRRVTALAQAADAKNPDQFIEHVADTVEYRAGGDKPSILSRSDLRNLPFWDMLRQFNVHVAVWDFSRDDVKEIDANTIEVGFAAKGESDGKPFPLYMRGTFKKQPDGQWKLTAFSSFKFENHNEPLAIPNLGK